MNKEQLAAWHDKADQLKKCVDYATSGSEQIHFRQELATHLRLATPPTLTNSLLNGLGGLKYGDGVIRAL